MEDRTNEVVNWAKDALWKYDSDNVDVVQNEETGTLDIMYHSDNNSFCIKETGIDLCNVSKRSLVKQLDSYGIGHCW